MVKEKADLIQCSISLLLTTTLFFIIPSNQLVSLILIILILLQGTLLYRTVQHHQICNTILIQGREILRGQLNRRILIKGEGVYAELVIIFNQMTEKLQNQVITNQLSKDARKRLLANISHDIRTPLTSILGYVEALRDDITLDQQERDDYLQILIDKSKNLRRMIDELFLLARLDSEDFELQLEVLDLAELTRECLIDFLPLIKNEDLATQIDLPEEDCLIYADRLSVERSIKNILKNCIQYGKVGKIIGIQLYLQQDGFILSIWDQGPGIHSEDLPYVFERLYMGDQTRKKPTSGTGLGLAITRKLLEKHGGTISVESIPEQKTTFQIYFPSLRKS